MSKDKPSKKPYNNFKDLQNQIDDAREKRDSLNQNTKEYINSLQEIEEQIKTQLEVAKQYKTYRDKWNDRVAKLKDKKIEYKDMLYEIVNKINAFKKGRDKNKGKYISSKKIDNKIDNLERIIETESLDLSEENQIIEQIRELAKKKQEVLAEDEYNDIMKQEKKIDIIKINLDKIYEKISKWSNKSQSFHNKMHETYEQVNSLKDKKRQIEEKLIANKKEADAYHERFLELMKKRKNIPRGRGRGRDRGRYYKKSQKNQKLEKIMESKLQTALEKQKAGKKLNIYEARLILEKTKK